MIDAEEDEDVVFEGSAIDQHLQNIGFSDYEATKANSTPHPKDVSSQNEKFKVDWLYLKKKLFGFITYLIWPKELEKNQYKRIVQDIYKSKILISDDHLLLKHFLPDHFFLPEKAARFSVIIEIFLWCLIRLVLSSSLCLAVIFLFLRNLTDWGFVFFPFILTVVVWLVTVSIMVYRSTLEVNSFVDGLRNATHLFSKSMRFLLEEDLVSRGFFLAQGSSSFTSRDRREAPYCEGLRHTLHDALYTMLPVLLHSHEHFETSVSYYPCMRGLFDEFEEMNLEMRQDVTEHLKFLKKLVTLVKLQTSAVLTEFILCTVDPEAFETLIDLNFVPSCLLDQVTKATDLLGKHFRYAESFWQKDVDDDPKISCEDKMNNVYIALHSLSLHMQASLYKIQELEKKFKLSESGNFTPGNKNANEKTIPPYEHVKELLDLIQIELQSCQGCFDETTARVSRKYEIKEEKTDKVPSNIVEDITSNIPSKREPIPLFDLRDPIIQDEVFEAYIEEGYDYQNEESDDDFWNTDARQERKKLKRQKEQGKRVLHELQPLLSKLRETWEEREMAALQRQKGDVSEAEVVDSSKCKEPRTEEEEDVELTTESIVSVKTKGKMMAENSNSSGEGECSFKADMKSELEEAHNAKLEFQTRLENELDNFDESRNQNCSDNVLGTYTKTVERDNNLDCGIGKGKSYQIDNLGLKDIPDLSSDDRRGLFQKHDNESDGELDVKDQQAKKDYHLFVQNAFGGSKAIEIGSNSALPSSLMVETHIGDISPSHSKNDDKSLVCTEQKEEVFGDETDDEDDDSPHIDWNTFTLPARLTDTLEDRMQLFSGQKMGFHSDIAAQVQAASQQFLLNKGNNTETFLGVGENEEVFGDSESESDH